MEITKKLTLITSKIDFKKSLELINNNNHNTHLVSCERILKLNDNSPTGLIEEIKNITSDIIILDRPETGINIDNILKFTDDLLKWINVYNEKKIVVLTHNDFIVREINCLIVLGSLNFPITKIQRLKYPPLKEVIDAEIHYNDVEVITVHSDQEDDYETCNIDEKGFNIDTFVKPFNKQDALYDTADILVPLDKKRFVESKKKMNKPRNMNNIKT